jgi:hypothetical protein
MNKGSTETAKEYTSCASLAAPLALVFVDGLGKLLTPAHVPMRLGQT